MDILNEQNNELSLMRALMGETEPNNNVMCSLVRNATTLNATEYDQSALHVAANKNFLNSARILLEAGASVDVRGLGKLTPLHLCSSNKHGTEMVQELLKYGADVSAEDRHKNTPLHLASHFQCVDVIQELLKHEVNVNASNHYGNTPLFMALYYYQCPELVTVQVLLGAGADLNSRGEVGQSPLHVAVLSNDLRIVQLLIKNNAELDACDADGCRPLHWAAKGKYVPIEMIRELLKSGATLNALNAEGQSALYYAVDSYNVEATRELLRWGAPSALVANMKAIECRSDIENQNHINDITTIFQDLIRYLFIESTGSVKTIHRRFRRYGVVSFLRKWSTPDCNLKSFYDACSTEVDALSKVSCGCEKSTVWGSINNRENCCCDTCFAILKFLVSGRPSNFTDHFFHKLGKEFLLEMVINQLSFLEFKKSRKRVMLNWPCMVEIGRYVSFEDLQLFFQSEESVMDDGKYFELLAFIKEETPDESSC